MYIGHFSILFKQILWKHAVNKICNSNSDTLKNLDKVEVVKVKKTSQANHFILDTPIFFNFYYKLLGLPKYPVSLSMVNNSFMNKAVAAMTK